MVNYVTGTAVADEIINERGQVIDRQFGGAGITASIALKRAAPNEQCVFIGEISRDEVGQQFQKLLRNAGVGFLPQLISDRASSKATWMVKEVDGKQDKELVGKKLLEPWDQTAEVLAALPLAKGDIIAPMSMTTTEYLEQFIDFLLRGREVGAMVTSAPNTRAFKINDRDSYADKKKARAGRVRYSIKWRRQLEASDIAFTAISDLDALYRGLVPHLKQDHIEVFGQQNLSPHRIITQRTDPTIVQVEAPWVAGKRQSFAQNSISVDVVEGVQNIVGTGDHLFGNFLAVLAKERIGARDLNMDVLMRAVKIGQQETRIELLRRKGLEQANAANKPTGPVEQPR